MIHSEQAFGSGFLAELSDEVAAGYIRTQVHPHHWLTIYNYAEKTTFERRWNTATLNSRGLILDAEGYIIARPFKKFMNHGEPGAAEFKHNDRVIAYDKLDGSLGILYQTPDGSPAIATRGSFSSDQAIHATAVLHERYYDWAMEHLADSSGIGSPSTALMEIVYPQNRIVCDYGDQDDLFVLGSIFHETGKFLNPEALGFPGPIVNNLGCMAFMDALKLPDREGKEGLVLYNVETEDRVKLKQEDYVRLHKIVTNLNERAVWEILKTSDNGDAVNAWIAQLPDEFHRWAQDTVSKLVGQFMEILSVIGEEHKAIKGLCTPLPGEEIDRKLFASYAVTSPYAWAHFNMLDGKDFSVKIWDMIKPEAFKTPHGRTVDDEVSL